MMVEVIGAGLAGCEAAWALACRGVAVRLHEMKPHKYTPAHSYEGFAELVCSNSLKAARLGSAAGMLKEEMRIMGSLIMECADSTSVPAGGALAVDRVLFSDLVTQRIKSHPLITIIGGEVTQIPEGNVIVASGPLTSDALAEQLQELCGQALSFFDAAAPIVSLASLDMDQVFYAARYDRGEDDYINCPMDKDTYDRFVEALVAAERAELKSFENLKVYEGCMPVEVMAARGHDTLRHGPMKPVGLRDPRTGRRPWAVVQLRKENTEGSLYNLVGFQTNLKFAEQKRVFSMIPGLENVEIMRYGVMHRNTFIDSPRLLNRDFSFRARPELFFAGQITGVEGYIESAASGIVAGINMYRRLTGKASLELPAVSMIGALSHYISDPSVANFQPMGSNMGILPPLEQTIRDKSERYLTIASRGVEEFRKIDFQ